MNVEDLKIWFREKGYSDYLLRTRLKRPLDALQVMRIIALK